MTKAEHEKEGKNEMKKIGIVFLILFLTGLCGCAVLRYHEAKGRMESGDYAAAKEILLENPDYEDSGELIRECDYNIAKTLMEQNEYSAAKEIFLGLSDFRDSEDLILECECRAFYFDSLVGEWQSALAISGGQPFTGTDFRLELREDFTFEITKDSAPFSEGECRFPDYRHEKKLLYLGSDMFGMLDGDGSFLVAIGDGTEGISFRRS